MIDYPDEWDTEALTRDFEVESFFYDICFVKRRADGVKGSLTFHRDPERNTRIYTNWSAE
jgi:hypothetical protein